MVPPVEITGELKQVTQMGNNFEPSFSPDGKKIVFIGQDRPQHTYGQIYELNLETQREQRLTFQGADNSSPKYIRNGSWIVYSSATDETKENPKRIQESLDADQKNSSFKGPQFLSGPMDVYMHDLKSLNIVRLTSTPGFDGRPFFDPKTENIVFTRQRKNQVYLFSVSAKRPLITKPFSNTVNVSDWTQSLDRSHQAWIEWKDDFKTSELKVKTPTGLITLLPDFNRIKIDPSFVPGTNIILFAMNHPVETSYNVFSVEADGTCLTQWTNNEFLNTSPQVSSDLKSLAFASNRKGSHQIYIKDWPQTPPCRTP